MENSGFRPIIDSIIEGLENPISVNAQNIRNKMQSAKKNAKSASLPYYQEIILANNLRGQQNSKFDFKI